MTPEVRVFVNEQAVVVSGDKTVADAVAAFDRSLSDALSGESGYLTDGVGRRLSGDTVVEDGMIVRVISGGRPTDEQ
jgi:hypothetical protein